MGSKLAIAFVSTTVLMLTGCATTMTPEQHNTFALDYALLNICSEKGLMDQNLAANGLSFYREILNRYKTDDNLIDSQVNQYYQRRNEVDSNLCNRYSVTLRSELIQQQKTAQSLAEFNNAMAGFSDSMQKSTEATRKSMDSFNSRPKNQSCYNDGFGGVNCYTY